MRQCLTCIFMLTLTGIIGCGGAAQIPISGVVTYNGQPVKAANVLFVGKTSDQITTAATDDQGKFAGVKVAVGEYKVAITPKTDVQTEGTISYDAPTRAPFPAKYTSIDGSGLKATLARGSEDSFKFELTD